MKTNANARPRAAALLLAAAALPFTPAFAQVTTPDAAPPVAATVPSTTPPEAAPAPVAAAPAAAPAPVFAAPSPVVQATPPRPAPVAEAPVETATEAAPARRTAPVRTAKPVAAKRAAVSAPVVAAAVAPAVTPAPQAAPAPTSSQPVGQTPFAEPTPAADAPPPVTSGDTTTVTTERPVWPFVVGALALLGLIIAALSYGRRRRALAQYDNYYADEEVSTTAPVLATPTVPVARTAPVMTSPVEQPVAAYALHNDERPWIGLTLLPLRVGSQGDEMVVQYELTVENAGTVAAEGVRVSSFLIDDRETDDASGRITALGEVQSHVIDVAPGGSVPLTTTITVDRSKIVDGQFLPKVVADAIYPLPGNREGHFAARFAMGIADGDDLSAVDVAKEDTMHDDVGARLDDVLERA